MEHVEMMRIAAQLVRELDLEQVGEFAEVLKDAVQQGYTTEQLEIIDKQLLSVGIDIRINKT